jgi:tetratricopeptide (TPR) repeat protein
MLMTAQDCARVQTYLETFGRKGTEADDVDRISDHVKSCAACFRRVGDFFRLMTPPTTGYLKESIDDLTLSVYNLVKAILKKAPADPGEEKHENLKFTQEPGDADQYVKDGAECIDDVEDYLGTDQVRGQSIETLRALMEQSHKQLAMDLLQKGVDLGGLYSWDCRNLQGVLHLYGGRLDDAERSFAQVVTAVHEDSYVRTVQAHSMINLAYVYQGKGRYDDAVKWGERSKALAEELNLSTFWSRFGLSYFYLLRDKPGDVERAGAEIEAMLASAALAVDFHCYINADANKVIRGLYDQRGLAERFRL